jgi:copper chaperone CopZ
VNPEEGSKTMAKVEHVELAVQDKAIHCNGCESRIETVLKKLPGKVKADHKTQKVTITLDPEKAPIGQIRAKPEELGYKTSQ